MDFDHAQAARVGELEPVLYRAGLRPATPTSAPILGPAPGLPNLMLDVGQGALGFTLAMASGRVVADLLAGRPPPVPIGGFDAASHGVGG